MGIASRFYLFKKGATSARFNFTHFFFLSFFLEFFSSLLFVTQAVGPDDYNLGMLLPDSFMILSRESSQVRGEKQAQKRCLY